MQKKSDRMPFGDPSVRSMHSFHTRSVLTIGLFLFGMVSAMDAAAAFAPPARVTFTFDESSRTMVERAAPIFEQYGVPAVIYAETALIGSGDWAMTYADLKDLRDRLGWEIGSHSATHPDLTKVSSAQLQQELLGSKNTFQQNGIVTTAFATPLGAYNTAVLKAIAQVYTSHRAAWGGPNTWPDGENNYELLALEVKHDIPPETVLQWIDDAIANKQWLVLLLHDVVEGTPAQYEYNKADLEKIVAYAASKPIAVTTIESGKKLAKGENLVQNPSFELMTGKFATGWSRTNTQAVLTDAKKNGSAPSPHRSLQLLGKAAQNGALSSPITVGQTDYLLKVFENSTRMTGGGWAVWVNEYGASNTWISGQWLGGGYVPRIGTRMFSYAPSSADVQSMQLFLYIEAGSTGITYLDSVEFRAIGDVPPPPPPPPPSINLMPNGSFEELTSGFARGWGRTSEGSVIIDGNNNGTSPSPLRSVKITAGTSFQSVISSPIAISDTSATYDLSFFQKMENFGGGGMAVWVNEYDAANTWVGGQWLGGRYSALEGEMKLPYKPLNASVASAEFYLYAEEGSSMTLFIDEVALRKR